LPLDWKGFEIFARETCGEVNENEDGESYPKKAAAKVATDDGQEFSDVTFGLVARQLADRGRPSISTSHSLERYLEHPPSVP
jgi:hypothetical protein